MFCMSHLEGTRDYFLFSLLNNHTRVKNWDLKPFSQNLSVCQQWRCSSGDAWFHLIFLSVYGNSDY